MTFMVEELHTDLKYSILVFEQFQIILSFFFFN